MTPEVPIEASAPAKAKWSVRGFLRKQWQAIKAEQATPERLGLAVGVGVLIGCSPFWGLQTLIALGLAWLLRLNKLAVVVGTQVALPPMTPFIIFGGAQLGELMLRQRLLPLTFAQVRALSGGEALRALLLDLTVGGLSLGALLGLLLGGATTWVLRRQRSAAQPVIEG